MYLNQEFHRFSWPYQDKVRYLKFEITVLPFGLGTGPCIFTKVMRPLVKHWRGQAYRIVFFLDDGQGACPSFDSALLQSSSVRADLVNCSFVPSELKCNYMVSNAKYTVARIRVGFETTAFIVHT